jgi:hypothetical protein
VNTKKVACVQANFLAYPGYFQVMDAVDEYYYMTDVQFSERSWQQRNKIRTPFHWDKHKKERVGWMWLKVPTIHAKKGTPERILANTLIDNSVPWRYRHLESIASFYAKSEWYEKYYPELEGIYMREWDRLVDLDIALTEWMAGHLEVKTPTFLEGELPYDRDTGHDDEGKTQRLINFCDAVGADVYLEPGGGAAFIVDKMFELKGIELRYLHYEPPQYIQLFEDFVPYMSALDLLFCLGPRAKNKIAIEWYDTEIREDHRDKSVDWSDMGM